MNHNTLRKCAPTIAATLVMLLPALAHAAGTGIPWEDPIDDFLASLTGPVIRAAGIIAIMLAGAGFAFSEGGSFTRKIIGILMGISIAFAAATWGLTFFGYSGGATF